MIQQQLLGYCKHDDCVTDNHTELLRYKTVLYDEYMVPLIHPHKIQYSIFIVHAGINFEHGVPHQLFW